MRLALIFFSFCLFIGCVDDYPQSFPIVLTEKVTNISPEGVVFSGSVESLGVGQTIIRYGFVWSVTENPTLDVSRKLSIAHNIRKGEFSQAVTYDLRPDYNYYVRSYIETETQVVYGNTLEFKSQGSLPPSITDFTPSAGSPGTEIIITGHNFSSIVQGNIVRVVGLPCKVLEASSTVLKVLLPPTYVEGLHGKIFVKVGLQSTYSEAEFTILP